MLDVSAQYEIRMAVCDKDALLYRSALFNLFCNMKKKSYKHTIKAIETDSLSHLHTHAPHFISLHFFLFPISLSLSLTLSLSQPISLFPSLSLSLPPSFCLPLSSPLSSALSSLTCTYSRNLFFLPLYYSTSMFSLATYSI